MERELYLERMRYRGSLQPTLEALRSLHVRHLETIPFENLALLLDQAPLALEEDVLFDRLVRGHRGGVRHALNALFAALLRSLGFQVSYLSARVAPEDSTRAPSGFEHLVLEVALEERWLVDVGFGASFDEPLPLVPGRWPSAGRMFRLDVHGEEWSLTRESPGGVGRLLYVFSRTPRRLEDFAERFRALQTSPDSPLRAESLCTRKTPRGRVTLRGNRLILSEDGHRVERRLAATEARDQLLLSHFGIPLPEGA